MYDIAKYPNAVNMHAAHPSPTTNAIELVPGIDMADNARDVPITSGNTHPKSTSDLTTCLRRTANSRQLVFGFERVLFVISSNKNYGEKVANPNSFCR